MFCKKLDTIYFIARSTKNFSSKINFARSKIGFTEDAQKLSSQGRGNTDKEQCIHHNFAQKLRRQVCKEQF